MYTDSEIVNATTDKTSTQSKSIPPECEVLHTLVGCSLGVRLVTCSDASHVKHDNLVTHLEPTVIRSHAHIFSLKGCFAADVEHHRQWGVLQQTDKGSSLLASEIASHLSRTVDSALNDGRLDDL